jgi:hypothetical protein
MDVISYKISFFFYKYLFVGWHDSFYWTVREILLYDNTDIGRLKTVIDCRQQGFLGVTNVVNYIGNHDHDRMLVELGTVLMLIPINRNFFY